MDNSSGNLKDHQQIKRNPWRGSGIKGEMESLIIAAEDQALKTPYH